ncbi:MAG: hypothetical protein ACRDRP_05755 [Pseudonocardiaceae bacterium]
MIADRTVVTGGAGFVGTHPFVDADVTVGIPVEPPVTHVLHLASPASPVDYVKHPVETRALPGQRQPDTLALLRR